MLSGSCLCGQVTYEISGETSNTAICHCLDCQKWCGAVASSNMIVPNDQLNITKGSDVIKKYGLKADSGKTNSREFCGNCGTSLFSRLDAMPENVVVKTGALDGGAADYKKVKAELYTKDRLSFAQPIEGAEQKETM